MRLHHSKDELKALFCDGLSVGGNECTAYGIQNFVDSFDTYFETGTMDVTGVVEDIMDRVDEELNMRAGFLTKLAAAIDASCTSYRYGIYSQAESLVDFDSLLFSGNAHRKAKLPSDMADNDIYGQEVSLTKSTYRLPNNVDYTDEHIMKDAAVSHMLESTMVDLHDEYCVDDDGTTSFCSMYFGTINGLFRVFPGTEMSKNDNGQYNSYDPRFRPWYVSAASGSKDVVILLDISGSMLQNGRMALAKDAVVSVLKTLGQSSLVSVVAFNHDVKLTCFGEEFVAATPRNVAKLVDFVEGLSATGGTNFEAAFETAFDILAAHSQSCKSSILFLTDGVAEDVTDLVRRRNVEDISATVFSYTLGDGADTTVPWKVANVTGGIYTHIADGDDNLLTVMSSYYLYYAYGDVEDNSDLVVTSPYLDFGTGVAMITMAMPVYFDEFFIGVVGIDIPLTFLSEAIGEVVLGRKSYSFIVNQENEAILHPLVPNPLTTLFSVGDEYNPVFIGDLEPAEFDDAAMLNALEGTQKIEGTVKTPAGDVTVSGYNFNTEHLLYFYKKVGPSSLTLNIVMYTDDDTDEPEIPGFGFTLPVSGECNAEELEPSDCLSPFVLYHNLTLAAACEMDWKDEAGIVKSAATDNFGSEDYAAWFLQAGGWDSPNAAINGHMSCDELDALHKFTNQLAVIQQSSMPFGGLRSEMWAKIKNQIMTLPSMGQFWKAGYLAVDSVFYQIYFASYQGLHITYPARTMSAHYNPVIRPWYRAAASQPDKLVVTTPYVDFSTGELVATGAAVITAPDTDFTFGVAAFDYEFSEFLDYWDDTLNAECQYSDGHVCYLIDSSAFMLYYSGIAGDVDDDDISHKFIGDLEPTLFQSLMDIGFFKNNTHANYLEDSLDVSYTADEDLYRSEYLNETTRSFLYNTGLYTVHQIRGTNLYLIHIDNYGLTGSQYPGNCPETACESVRTPGCIKDNNGDCVPVVADACVTPDVPARPSVQCAASSLDENTQCILTKGVQSDFCASDYDEDCEYYDAAVVEGPLASMVVVATVFVLSMNR